MPLESPIYLAKEIAQLLESDPIAAGQVKEHVSRKQLAELLGLTREQCYFEPATIKEWFNESSFGEKEMMQFITSRYSQADILSAFRRAGAR